MTRESKERFGGPRNYHLRRRYGITAAQFDRLYAHQDGRCAICRELPAEHVDHDHASGVVRGLLFNCNGALGQFRDRPDLMLRAITYLGGPDLGELAMQPNFRVGLYLVPGDDERVEETA